MKTVPESDEALVELVLEIRFRDSEPRDSIRLLLEAHKGLSITQLKNALSEIRLRIDSHPELVKKDSNEKRLHTFRLWLNGATYRSDGISLPEDECESEFPAAYVTAFLVDNVCEFAGHAWLRRADGQVADFLPDLQASDTWRNTELSVEDVICDILLPLVKGIQGKVFRRSPAQQPSQWTQDWPENFPRWRISVAEGASYEIPSHLLIGLIYTFTPNRESSNDTDDPKHNCLTWAAHVLNFKRKGWFSSLKVAHPDWDSKLEKHIFRTGQMNEVRRILVNDLKPRTRSK